MQTIELTKGFHAIVDDEDYHALSRFKWCYDHGYAVRSQGRKKITMQAHLLGERPGALIDHKNLNTLDNRRSNLRFATKSQNTANAGLPSHNTSGFKGVYPVGHKWQARIGVNGKFLYLGNFTDKIDAARAYNDAALQYFGEFARLNEV